MLSYATIGALDLEAVLPFYDAFLGAIGYERRFFGGAWARYGPPGEADNLFVCPPSTLNKLCVFGRPAG